MILNRIALIPLSLFALIADGSEAPSGIRPVLTALDQIDERSSSKTRLQFRQRTQSQLQHAPLAVDDQCHLTCPGVRHLKSP